MKYSDMTLQELRHQYLTTKNPLEKALLFKYGKYRKLQTMTIEQLRVEWKSADDAEQKAIIEKIAKNT